MGNRFRGLSSFACPNIPQVIMAIKAPSYVKQMVHIGGRYSPTHAEQGSPPRQSGALSRYSLHQLLIL